MSCAFDKGIIQKYADNTIDPLEFIFLKEHINYCEECRKELDMVMTLENALEKFFEGDSEEKDLELFITSLVNDCMCELNKREKLKYTLKKTIEIGSGIMDNSLRFVGYIPGSRGVGKGVMRTASAAGNFITTLTKKEIGRILTNLR
jgi:hypothetical protein